MDKCDVYSVVQCTVTVLYSECQETAYAKRSEALRTICAASQDQEDKRDKQDILRPSLLIYLIVSTHLRQKTVSSRVTTLHIILKVSDIFNDYIQIFVLI